MIHRRMFRIMKVNKQKTVDSSDYLNKDNTDCLKGMFSLAVILCHIRGQLDCFNDTIMGQLLTVMGYLSVAVFFFLSGYGLNYSYKKKGIEYINQFPIRRIAPFYFMCIFSVIIYAVYYVLIKGVLVSVKSFVMFLLFGGTIIINGWYLQTILLFYILFWCVFKNVKNQKWRIVFITLGAAMYCATCIVLKYDLYWYDAVFAYPLGMIWCDYKSDIDTYLKNNKCYFITICLIFIIFSITLLLGNLLMFNYMMVICKWISAIAFVLLIIMLIKKVRIDYKITRWLGKYFFEIYMIHGMFLYIFKENVKLENELIYSMAVIASSILCAHLLNPIYQVIKKFLLLDLEIK